MDINQEISEQLLLIGLYYQTENNIYRSKSYISASESIVYHPDEIISGQQARNEIKGIGVSIAKDVDEYLTTGEMSRLKELETKHLERKQIIDYFTTFYGIGVKTANKFYDKGYRTLFDIWDNETLTKSQKLGVEYRYHLRLRIPRWEMDLINAQLQTLFRNANWELVGSYRRRESDSGDIDVLIKEKSDISINTIIKMLGNLLVGHLAVGSVKYMGVFRYANEYNAHRIDIRVIPEKHWYFALLHFTGSKRSNILLRRRANQLGFKLNEYGLYDLNLNPNYSINVTSEEAIYDILRIKYQPPWERSNNLVVLPTY